MPDKPTDPKNADPKRPEPLDVTFSDVTGYLETAIGQHSPTSQRLLLESLTTWIRECRALRRRDDFGFPRL